VAAGCCILDDVELIEISMGCRGGRREFGIVILDYLKFYNGGVGRCAGSRNSTLDLDCQLNSIASQ